MKKTTQRVIATTLTFLALFFAIAVPIKNASSETCYNNIVQANVSSNINVNGALTVSFDVFGRKGVTTKIETELFVEKKMLGLFWVRVNIGCPNNLWTDSTNHYVYVNTFSTQLSSTGTYRTTVKFTVSGTGGANDIITLTRTNTY